MCESSVQSHFKTVFKTATSIFAVGAEVEYCVELWKILLPDHFALLPEFLAFVEENCHQTQSRRAAAGRAELLANPPAIRAQIFAGSIQTPNRSEYVCLN